MTWLDTLRDRGLQATGSSLAEPPIVRPTKPASEIKTVWVQTAPPRDGNAGAVEPGFYSFADGVVTMHEADGNPTGKTFPIGEGDDPHRVAHRLAREAWVKSLGESNFNGRLNYQPLGIA
jgi:hypothetical protein